MKIHEKANLYDNLLKEYEELINELKQYSDSFKDLENRSDMVEMKETNNSSYYPLLAGALKGSNFGLEIKISRAQSNLNWYKKQK
jgi:hypothetical protein